LVLLVKLRDNQKRVLSDLYSWFEQNKEGNPVVDAAVGSGKSVMISQLCKDAAFEFYPPSRVLVIVPSKELAEQNLSKLQTLAPELRIGVCSAALGKKETFRDTDVILGTIGTLYRLGEKLGRFHLVIVDESHLVSRSNVGMYRGLVSKLAEINPRIRVCGWTGTPYRGNGIWLTEGDERLFTDIAARLTMRELLDDGYLAPLVNAQTSTHISGDGIRTSGGDYVVSELAARIDQPGITEAVASEIVRTGEDRKKWLVYCVTIDHAIHMRDAIASRGIDAAVISSETTKHEREQIINEFRNGRLRCICNVAVLTTGFDLPEIDMIALVRNTRSPVLAVQIAGRGMRIHPGKKDCIFADFTDTLSRLGPIDLIKGRCAPVKREDSASTMIRICSNCGASNPINADRCHCCGQVFERPVSKVNTIASSAPVLSDVEMMWPVTRVVAYQERSKAGNDYLRVVFHCDNLERVSEPLMIGHDGYMGGIASHKWRSLTGEISTPDSASECARYLSEGVVQFRKVSSVSVRRDGRFYKITNINYANNP
jgi:DNA repair protein RadD